MKVGESFDRFLAFPAARRGWKITLVLLPVHVLVNLTGVVVAMRATFGNDPVELKSFLSAGPLFFIVGVPLLSWACLWLLGFAAFLLAELRQIRGGSPTKLPPE